MGRRDVKYGAAARSGHGPQLPAMLMDDRARQRESHPEAVGLRREERVETFETHPSG